jgi:hypothetical protein
MSDVELPGRKGIEAHTPQERKRWSTPLVILSTRASDDTNKPANIPDANSIGGLFAPDS